MKRHTVAGALLVCALAGMLASASAAPAQPSQAAPARHRHARSRHGAQAADEYRNWKETYQLDLDQGCPVITDYRLNGLHVRPLLDTGSMTGLYVSPQVYSHLKLKAPTQSQMSSFAGKQWSQETSQVLAPMLGSGRKRWFEVGALPPAPADAEPENSDSIFPLDILDGNIALFLLSRKQLWVGMDTPPEDGQPATADEADMQTIPYFDSTGALLVTIACEGQRYFAQLDTGSVYSTFSANFVAQHPKIFKATGETEDSYGIQVEMTLPIFECGEGLTLLGMEPKDDIAIPAGRYDALPGYDFEGKPAAASELGDPSTLPYNRADTPDIAPVAIIGMDILGQYDFCLYRNYKLMLLWPPSQTDKLFPQEKPQRRHRAQRKAARQQRASG